MLLIATTVLCLTQMASAQLQDLRRYRYGRTAIQVESMGLDAYQDFFAKTNPEAGTGTMRGVAYSVYIDAYRENTARRYRTPLSPESQSSLLALDKQIRFIGVLFARNAWLFTGGNAVDPESDDLSYAQAERRLYTWRSQEPEPERMRRRLAEYKTETLRNARKEKLYGAMGNLVRGREEIRASNKTPPASSSR